jgi:hypothetical protein
MASLAGPLGYVAPFLCKLLVIGSEKLVKKVLSFEGHVKLHENRVQGSIAAMIGPRSVMSLRWYFVPNTYKSLTFNTQVRDTVS